MTRQLHLATVLLVALLPDLGRGQAPPPPPARGPATLLFVRFVSPAGMRVTFYQGLAAPRSYPAPAAVGLRPGYVYRVKLSDIPGFPGETLYPSVEVRGMLQLPPHTLSSAYPAPVVLSEDDIRKALAGSLVTKVIYLEHPDKAPPTFAPPDLPIESDVPPGRDPLQEARDLGRPMLIVRLGEREFGASELGALSVPGTILFPGEKTLPPAPHGPWLPWACVPVYDPFQGPKPPEEECLHDGGDVGLPAGIDRDGRLGGLDPTDTVAEYTDVRGRRRVAISNRVCVCVPRFAVLRTETPPAGFDLTVALGGAQGVLAQERIRTNVPMLEADQYKQLAALRGRARPSATVNQQGLLLLSELRVLRAEEMLQGPAQLLGTQEVLRLTEVQRVQLMKQLELAKGFSQVQTTATAAGTLGTAVVGRVEGIGVIAGELETRELTVCCNEAPRPPEKPLVLFKWADATSAQVGDVITFYLKFSNHGGQPINDVAVSDSLTGRLEYIPGSAKSNRDAVFTTQPNEAGSLILRWEVTGRLLPGQSGVVSFQARVR